MLAVTTEEIVVIDTKVIWSITITSGEYFFPLSYFLLNRYNLKQLCQVSTLLCLLSTNRN